MSELEKNRLIGGCVRVLEQGHALLERLDDRLYTDTAGLPVQSGVGSHIRHCLDFYQSLLEGVWTGRVDYNRRERDALVARDRACAAARIEIVIEELRALADLPGDTTLLVSPEDTDADMWCASTLARELQFLLSHTVHHYALVALILRLQGFEPSEEFGVAPSTLAHRRQEALCAR
jgi:glutathione S-transferase